MRMPRHPPLYFSTHTTINRQLLRVSDPAFQGAQAPIAETGITQVPLEESGPSEISLPQFPKVRFTVAATLS
jgi:hypothetical protein